MKFKLGTDNGVYDLDDDTITPDTQFRIFLEKVGKVTTIPFDKIMSISTGTVPVKKHCPSKNNLCSTMKDLNLIVPQKLRVAHCYSHKFNTTSNQANNSNHSLLSTGVKRKINTLSTIENKPNPFLKNDYREFTKSSHQKVPKSSPIANVLPVDQIRKIILYPPPTELNKLSSIKPLTITTQDEEYLKPGVYLNDMILSLFMNVLQHDILKKKFEVINRELLFSASNLNDYHEAELFHIFSTHFWYKFNTVNNFESALNGGSLNFEKDCYERIKRWTKRIDIFKMKTVIIPINEHKHWHLCIINNLDKAFPKIRNNTGPLPSAAPKMGAGLFQKAKQTWDSIKMAQSYAPNNWGKDDSEINIMFLDSASFEGLTSSEVNEHYGVQYSKVVEYLKCEAKNKYQFNKNQVSNLGKKCRQIVCNVPKQMDGDSCGIFLIQYIQSIITDKSYVETIREKGANWFNRHYVNGEVGRNKLRGAFEELKQHTEKGGYLKSLDSSGKSVGDSGAVNLHDDVVVLD